MRPFLTACRKETVFCPCRLPRGIQIKVSLNRLDGTTLANHIAASRNYKQFSRHLSRHVHRKTVASCAKESDITRPPPHSLRKRLRLPPSDRESDLMTGSPFRGSPVSSPVTTAQGEATKIESPPPSSRSSLAAVGLEERRLEFLKTPNSSWGLPNGFVPNVVFAEVPQYTIIYIRICVIKQMTHGRTGCSKASQQMRSAI